MCSCHAMHNARTNHTTLYAIKFLTGLIYNFVVVKFEILLLDHLPTPSRIRFFRWFFNMKDKKTSTFMKIQLFLKMLLILKDSRENLIVQIVMPSTVFLLTCKGNFQIILPQMIKTLMLLLKLLMWNRLLHPSLLKNYDQLMHILQQSNRNEQVSTSSNQVHSFPSAGPQSNGKQNSTFSYSLSCQNFTLGTWIINSCASDHMCGSLKWFHSVLVWKTRF